MVFWQKYVETGDFRGSGSDARGVLVTAFVAAAALYPIVSVLEIFLRVITDRDDAAIRCARCDTLRWRGGVRSAAVTRCDRFLLDSPRSVVGLIAVSSCAAGSLEAGSTNRRIDLLAAACARQDFNACDELAVAEDRASVGVFVRSHMW